MDAQVNRLYPAISQLAEARYHPFVQAFPTFTQRLPLHLIASYLGMSCETLSRFRKQERFD